MHKCNFGNEFKLLKYIENLDWDITKFYRASSQIWPYILHCCRCRRLISQDVHK